MALDRFKKISNRYAEIWEEIFAQEGFSYAKLQYSVFDIVSQKNPFYKTAAILDIGCGDGETLAQFINSKCTNLTGIDINDDMLNASKKRFGNKVVLKKMDARNMTEFCHGQFEIITTGVCIHNISKLERKKFWSELKRLSPKLFVAAEKISDSDTKKHKESYDREIKAIITVYKERYKMDNIAEEWIRHYEYDEKEKLTIEEFEINLSNNYDISVTFEQGMNKTVLAVRKDFTTK